VPAPPLHDPTATPLPEAGTETRHTTCYMCACRCGIRVHLRQGGSGPEVRYIEGNPEHPLNRGVICAKGSSGIMKQYSPARLTQPLRRKAGAVRGHNAFEPISWEETFALLEDRLRRIRCTDPRQFALFTGRDQMQALTGLFARQFGTPSYAAHGGFCSVNMAAGMIYTIGGSFWEFGGADLDRARLFVMIGTAEDHHSNPLKIALGKFKRQGGRFVTINPVRTGYSAIADEWIPSKPGTDGALLPALVREIIALGLYDRDFLARYTNAGQLANQNAPSDEFGLMLCNAAGDVVNPLRPHNFFWWDRLSGRPVADHAEGADPRCWAASRCRTTRHGPRSRARPRCRPSSCSRSASSPARPSGRAASPAFLRRRSGAWPTRWASPQRPEDRAADRVDRLLGPAARVGHRQPAGLPCHARAGRA
jgi:anaerobic selenocysteine-containing dehydrogenase